MTKVQDVLNELKARSGAQAALIVSADGLVLDAVHDGDVATDALAAYAASHVMSAEQLGDDVQFGIPDAMIVMYREWALLMVPMAPAVVVLVGAVEQLGYLRLQLRRTFGALAAAVHEELDGNPLDHSQSHDTAPNGTSPRGPGNAGVDTVPALSRQAAARGGSVGARFRTGPGPAGNSSKQ